MFIKSNTYPITEFIIVNDSADPKIHKEIEETYEGATFVFNKENVGLIKSVDLGYEHIKTEYFFHSEDDWSYLGKGGFIEQSLRIMKAVPNIEEVWLKDMNNHPVNPKIYHVDGLPYRLIQDNYQKGKNGYNDFAWHGFTTACGLKRMSDYRKVGPYADIPWQGTIWHREQAIGERYHKLGYRTAILMEEYAKNIGYGQSEYVTGKEK
jgi:GT2 family glycosyltransferase